MCGFGIWAEITVPDFLGSVLEMRRERMRRERVRMRVEIMVIIERREYMGIIS